MAKKQKFYVVWEGREPGVFHSWEECYKQIKGFQGAVYKSFPTLEQAQKAFDGNSNDFIGKEVLKKSFSDEELKQIGKPVQESLSVDAACSGNPGVMEYRGVDTKSGIMLFSQGPYPHGTVNIGEFLAIVHGLAYLKQRNSNIPIYTDSQTAIKWVTAKQIKSKLERNQKSESLYKLVDRALNWLQNNSYNNRILKWNTAAWGEIPADYGRK